MGVTNTVLSAFALHPVRIGGVESYAAELSTQLADMGWKSVLVFLSPPSDEVNSLFALPNTRVEVIEECGKRAWRPLRAMAKLLAKVRPRIMHLHFMDAFSGYPWLARSYSAERIFLTDHNSRPEGHYTRPVALWKRPLFRLACLPITKVICVSSYVSRRVQHELGTLVRGIETVYVGVNTKRAEAGITRRDEFRRRHRIPEDRIVVLQVSWLIPEKGVADLLQAAQRVVARNERIHFLVAGDGPFHHEYERLAERLGIRANVSFLGVVRDPLGEGLFAACDILCQVSRWEEAFGLTIAEAMASCRPVIATRVGGIPESVEDGRSGSLIERGDSAALAERILQLAQDSLTQNSMGAAGRRICEAKFDLRRNVAKVIQLYGIPGEVYSSGSRGSV